MCYGDMLYQTHFIRATDLLLGVAPSSVDSVAGTLGSPTPQKLNASSFLFGCGDATETFGRGELDTNCSSFSASSPVGVAPPIRDGGPNRSSGFSFERGNNKP